MKIKNASLSHGSHLSVRLCDRKLACAHRRESQRGSNRQGYLDWRFRGDLAQIPLRASKQSPSLMGLSDTSHPCVHVRVCMFMYTRVSVSEGSALAAAVELLRTYIQLPAIGETGTQVQLLVKLNV